MATTQSNSDSDSDSNVHQTDSYDFQYEETNRKSYDCQQDVADAWAEGKYPTHNVGDDGAVLYSGTPSRSGGRRRRRSGSHDFSSRGAKGTRCNFYGVQHDDGSGTLWHYSTREAIRLTDGTVISNQQCWATGFAHCSTPTDYDYEIPLDAVEEHLDFDDTVFDIAGVMGQPQTTTYYSEYSDEFNTRTRISAEDSIVVVNGSDESYGIYLGRDGSIINGESHFSFRLSKDELQSMDAPSDALDLLVPDEVLRSGFDVVDSAEYTKTRLDEDEQEAHLNAGGKLSESQSRWRDQKLNRQHFRADLQGSTIVRHGEWFFIPKPLSEPPEQGSREAADVMDSHRAERFHGARMPLPTECECGSTSFDETDEWFECENGHEQPQNIYVCGEVRHTSNDHNAINLGDTWHLAVQHGWRVRTYDDNPGSGSHGGGGWD